MAFDSSMPAATADAEARQALLVGASGGIGAALARVLVEEGSGVTLSGRRPDRLATVAESLRDGPGEVAVETADLTADGVAAGLLARHLDRVGRLDVLVVASGTGRPTQLDAAEPNVLRRLIEVNVVATAAVLAAALPALRVSAAGGRGPLVVLLSSVVAVRSLPKYAAYSATKAAVTSLARSVNEEESAAGLRATAICPGFVHTPLTAGLPRGDAEAFLPPTDVAEALRFLLRLSPIARVPELILERRLVESGRP